MRSNWAFEANCLYAPASMWSLQEWYYSILKSSSLVRGMLHPPRQLLRLTEARHQCHISQLFVRNLTASSLYPSERQMKRVQELNKSDRLQIGSPTTTVLSAWSQHTFYKGTHEELIIFEVNFYYFSTHIRSLDKNKWLVFLFTGSVLVCVIHNCCFKPSCGWVYLNEPKQA